MMQRCGLLMMTVLVAGLLAGCQSQLPVASSSPMETQHKMQAARHWDILAEDVAQQSKKALDDRVELRLLAIDVIPDAQGPFAEVFRELLRSHLVHEGLQVSDKDEGQLELRFKVQMVKHGKRFQRTPPGLLSVLGAGIAVSRDLGADAVYAASVAGILADVAIGTLPGYSSHEVIITSSMVWRNRFVTHSSSIYYINDGDNRQYGQPIPPVGGDGLPAYTTKSMSVTNN
ncbi:hypothetical protein [Desulfobaculum sp.]